MMRFLRFKKNATFGMGKLDFFWTETPKRRQLLSFGEDQTVVSLKNYSRGEGTSRPTHRLSESFH